MEQAVSILALTRGCYSISTNNGLLLYTTKLDKVPLAPTTELSDDLVNRLVEAGLLSVCIQPGMDCELISGRLTTKNPKVTLQWRLPETSLETLIQAIVQTGRNTVWPMHWYG